MKSEQEEKKSGRNKTENRLQQLERVFPDIWNYKTMLYIGAKVVERSRAKWGGMRMLPEFHKMGYVIDILEVWPKNVEQLKKFNEEKKVFGSIVEGDVHNIRRLIRAKYDVVMWYHGPEHVEKNDLGPILREIESHAEKIAIIACPWGVYKQGSLGKNPHETHVSSLYPKDFKSLGWETDTLGEKDVEGSNILAWRRKQMSRTLRELPWLPEKAISFLDQILDKESSVLEFGAGSSTIWFAKHVKYVMAYENKMIWYNIVQEGLKRQGLNNVTLKMDPQYPGLGLHDVNQTFDLILIDGRGRVKCAHTCHENLKPGGWIGLDNSWRPRYIKIHMLFNKLEWERKDIFDYIMPENKMGDFTIWRKPQ